MTRSVRVGAVEIGGGRPVAVQSMTTTDTKDADATVAQILRLENAGCDIVRVALYDRECVASVEKIRSQIHIPLVGDVHFDWRIAVDAIEAGIDKIRINPGNIGLQKNVARVAAAARAQRIPIRVGANSGSLKGNADLVQSTMDNIRILESEHFEDIVVSVKSSSVRECVAAARQISALADYPLHLGVTEAGTAQHAVIKSAVGIGALLLDGIGDTVRVSVSGDPEAEVKAAHEILRACGREQAKLEIIACPTCARTGIPVEQLACEAEKLETLCAVPMRIAVMGCEVNGPGEAKRADLGIAGCADGVALFEDGEIRGRYPRERALEVLEDAVRRFQERRNEAWSLDRN